MAENNENKTDCSWRKKAAKEANKTASTSHQATPSQCFKESEKNITELIKGAERNVIQEISSVPKETQEMVLEAMDRQIRPVIIKAVNTCMAQLQTTSKVYFNDVSTQAPGDSPVRSATDENSSHPDLTHLDLATSSTKDSSFTDWANDPYTKQQLLKMKHLQREGTVLTQEKEAAQKELSHKMKEHEAKHEIAQHQIELQEGMVRSLQKEVTRLTQEQETAQKLLLDNKNEIEELTGANKGMGDTIDELLADKTKLTNKLAMLEEQRFRSRHAVGEASARETTKDTMDEEDKVTSLQGEVTQHKEEQEEVQKPLLDNKRENAAKRAMEDTIDELTKKLAKMEQEGKSKDDTLESLKMKVSQLTQEKEAAQKELSDKSQELEDLTGANNGLNDELTIKLARMEEEGKLKDRKVDSLQEEVTRLKQKAAAQKSLSDMKHVQSMNDEARGGAAGTTSDGSHHRGQRQHRFKLPSCLSPKTKP